MTMMASSTVRVDCGEKATGIVDPAVDGHVIAGERGHEAPEQSRIAQQHVLVVHLDVVALAHDWARTDGRGGGEEREEDGQFSAGYPRSRRSDGGRRRRSRSTPRRAARRSRTTARGTSTGPRCPSARTRRSPLARSLAKRLLQFLFQIFTIVSINQECKKGRVVRHHRRLVNQLAKSTDETVRVAVQRLAVTVDPRVDGHEIGNVRRDAAPHERPVAADHVLVAHLALVRLQHHFLTRTTRLRPNASSVTAAGLFPFSRETREKYRMTRRRG